MPALEPRQPDANFRISANRLATPNSKKAGSYMNDLVGDENGQGALHWRLVQEMDAIDGLIQENADRQKIQDSKQRQQQLLSEQVAEARKKDNDFRSSMARWGGKLKEDADRFQTEEKSKKIELIEAQRKHNEEMAYYAEDGRRRKQEEAASMARLESDMAKQAQDAKRRQDEIEDRKKRRQKETAQQMAKAAKDAVTQKAETKRLEALKDIELMRQQQAMLDEQDRRRAEAADKIRNQQGRAQAQFEAGAGNQIAKQQKEEEARAKRWQEERAAKDEASANEKQRKLKQMAMDGVAFVKQQLREHADAKVAEKEDMMRRREKSDQDAAKAADEEKKKADDRRQRARENQEFLQRQIDAKKTSHRAKEQMTEVEQSMNKDRLERARKPENLQLLFKSKQGQYARMNEQPE